MSVYLSINGTIANVPFDTIVGSKLIKNLLDDISDTSSVYIPIPDRYGSVISSYVSFVHGYKLPIDDANILINGLLLSNYLEDSGYFNYLLTFVFSDQAILQLVINDNDMSSELRHDISLVCPYEFIPQQFRDDDIFIKAWLQNNQHTVTMISDSNNYKCKYHNNELIVSGCRKDGMVHSGRVKLTSYCEIGTKSTSGRVNKHGNVYYYYTFSKYVKVNNTMIDASKPLINLSINGKKHGLWETWYDNRDENGQSYNGVNCGLKNKGYYNNGKKQGVWQTWYTDGCIQERCYYHNGKRQGLKEHWYANTNIDVKGKGKGLYDVGYYDNNRKHGVWEHFHKNGQIYDKYIYDKGKRQGLYQQWHENGQLIIEGHYDNNAKQGLWKTWFEHTSQRDENLYTKGSYVNGVKHGLWETWCIGGQLRESSNYHNGIEQQ